ncbi:MAG: acyltransferase [Devosia nanyangense]|uniref:Acyltransferase n=1 Tax=Devosia nanyangense TaxID=1228055 RepID=A0A933KZV4_9HYPH|nr:acyltransferase [Devosia nanyangense]
MPNTGPLLRATRVGALDGLRGWAALSVVVYHCFWQTFGVLFPETHTLIPALLGNGLMAVAVFLTLSGYVLTTRRWRRNDNPPLLLSAVRRYIRLTLPIIAAVLLVWVLMSLQLTPTKRAFEITGVHSWYDTFARFKPDLMAALSFATLRVYGAALTQNYGPFLWTMVVELWGSLLVFAISQSGRALREPYTPLLLVAVLCLAMFPLAACFPIGALIALLEHDGVLFRGEPSQRESRIATAALLAILVAGALVQMYLPGLLLPALLGVGVFLAVKRSLPAQWFLELPVSTLLGRLSFPLYLVQYAVIISLSALLIVWLEANGMLNLTTALLTALASIAASVGLAVLFLPVELLTLGLLRRIDSAWQRWREPKARGAAVPST